MRLARRAFSFSQQQQIQDDVKALEASPGDNNLVQGKNFKVVLTVETAKSATEFEWHEGRDHILLVLDGETVYQVGGTPKGAHSMGPGEWHAPEAEGATTLDAQEGRHAGDSARHAAQAEHSGNRDVLSDIAARDVKLGYRSS